MLEPKKNFLQVEVDGEYNNSVTEIDLKTGDGAELPDPDTSCCFLMTWYNHTDYPDIYSDPNKEIILVESVAVDTLQILREQGGTIASTKNESGKIYKLIQGYYAEDQNLVDDVLKFFDGSVIDSTEISINSNGTTVTFSIEKKGTGDIRFGFSTGVYTWDTTPPVSINLNAGSDVSPQINYVYFLESTKTLIVSTVGFPSGDVEYAPLSEVLVQSPASAQNYGVYKMHKWEDHIDSDENNGHANHINFWIRQQNATYLNGILLTPSVGSSIFDIETSSGQILQLHKHTFPSFDTSVSSDIYIANDPTTPYLRKGDLTGLTQDADGNTLGGVSSDNYNLVIWGSVSEETGDCKLFCNLPSGSYANNNSNIAVDDLSNTAIYTMPIDFRGTSFLIARLTVSINAGTYSILYNEDLTGSVPSNSAGGGASGGVEFADNVFRINNTVDSTKQIDFDASGVATGTKRTIVMPDKNVDLGALAVIGETINVLGGEAFKLDFINSGGRPFTFYDNGVFVGGIDYNFGNNSFSFDVTNAVGDRITNAFVVLSETNNNYIGLGIEIPTAKIHIVGNTNNNSAYAQKIVDSLLANLFSVRNDGQIALKNFAFPIADGSADQVMKTDGSGVLSWVSQAGAIISSVFGRVGVVVAENNDYTWAQINKAISDIADITNRSHTDLTDKGTNTHTQIDAHISNVSNPHSVSQIQVGLSNVTNTSDATKNSAIATLTNKTIGTDNLISFNSPRGFLINGKIVPSVASNNLSVSIKGLDGNDPSSSNPVYCRIGDNIRSITSALSVTKNAGTNYFNAGRLELASEEIDYFVYLGYNATDGVVIGFSRIPYANEYDDFSTISTNEEYCAISTISNALSGDDYEIIGRFAAILSAGAGYTWSVPTFTNKNLIQRPCYSTRKLFWNPVYGGSGGMTFTSVTEAYNYYVLDKNKMTAQLKATGTTGGIASNTINLTLPFSSLIDQIAQTGRVIDSAGGVGSFWSQTTTMQCRKFDNSNFGLGSGRQVWVNSTDLIK